MIPSSAVAFVTAIAVMLFGLISSVSRPAACASSAESMAGILLSNSIVRPIADGATFERMTALTSAGWVQMSVMRVDLSSPSIAVGPVLADGVLTSPKSVTSIAKECGLVAAINGDFFDMGATSAPLSLLVADGQIIRSPRKDSDFASLVIFEDDTGLVGQWTWKGVLKGPNGIEITLAGLNEISVPSNLAVLYDHHWSWERRPGNSDVHHLAIREGVVESFSAGWPAPKSSASPNGMNGSSSAPTPGDQPGADGTAGSCTDADAQAPELSNDELIYVVLRGHSAQIAQKLLPGDPVSIEATLAPTTPGILSAFSGKPVLVEDGAVVSGLWAHTGIQSLFAAPRTAVGLTEDGKTLIMAVVDGRLPGARGITLKELAEIMISLGAHEALNLDGGGSSTAAIQDLITGRVVLANRPSGGAQRRVPYAIGVWHTASQAAEADSEDGGSAFDDNQSAARIPAFISVSVESERLTANVEDLGGAGSDDATERTHLGSFPSIEAAVIGGPTFLAGSEVSLDVHSNAILTAAVYDSSGQPMDPDNIPDNVEIVWEITPPKNLRGIPLPEELWSVSEDSFSAVLFCGTPGRFGITVKAVEAEQELASGEVAVQPETPIGEGSPLAQTSLSVRTVDQENAIVPMAIGTNARMVNEASVCIALVEDFESAIPWVGAASSPSVGCVVETLNMETPESECPPPVASEAGKLPEPAGMALAMDYDLRAPEQTRAAYVRPPRPTLLPVGTSAILMWVYGDGGGNWLRATIRDSHGKEAPIDFPRIDWVGWRVVEASIPAALVPPFHLVQVYIVEFKSELKSAGRIVIDNVSTLMAQVGPRPLDQDIEKLLHSTPGRHVVRIDAASRPLPWQDMLAEFEHFKASDEIELVVVLRGPNAVDIDSLEVGEAFRDPLEAELLMEILKSLADGATSVVLVQDAPATSMLAGMLGAGRNMEAFIDGIQVIWRESELEAENGSAFLRGN
jgi:hypothetical protein